MMRLHKILHVRPSYKGEHVEVATVAEAVGHFDDEVAYVIVRHDSDEDWLALEEALTAKNQTVMQYAVGPTCWVWQAKILQVDGDGWRGCWKRALLEKQAVAGPQMRPVGRG